MSGAPAVFFSEAWPRMDPALYGREAVVTRLDEAWENPETHIISFVAWGGVGKTALVDRWVKRHMLPEGWRGAERVFAWSFYSQGASADRQASADTFIARALRWFGDPELADSARPAYEKGERLARLVCQRRTLLLLDGVEPLQEPPPSPTAGRLRDPALQVLLRALAYANRGLCVVTTRLQVEDLKAFEDTTVQPVDLDHLPHDAGAEYLRHLGVNGTQKELNKVSREFGGHALALTLLGRYLAVVEDGDIRRRDKIPALVAEEKHGGHARRMIERYEQWFKGKPELDILRILGLFDRPAEAGAIELFRTGSPIKGLTEQVSGLSDAKWKFALERLREVRLLGGEHGESGDPNNRGRIGATPQSPERKRGVKQPVACAPGSVKGRVTAHADLDCHPLVREHFAARLQTDNADAWCEGHERLYEYFQSLPEKDLPDTVEEMMPLYQAVAHGCHAGRYQEALDNVYWPRIQRGSEYYASKKLGAMGADLAALAGFFDPPWKRPVDRLAEADRGFVLNEAGSYLRALGRLAEAVSPMQAGLEMTVAREDWKNAAVAASNQSALHLALGDVERAREYADQSVRYADDSKDAFERMGKRGTLADALHQAGRFAEADDAFREAEAMQAERQREYPLLYSLVGFRFCDLLLGRGEHQEAKRRALQTLEWVTTQGWLLDIALDHLTLGRAHLLSACARMDATSQSPEFQSPERKRGVREPVARARGSDKERVAARGDSGVVEEATGDFGEATVHLDQAVDGLRNAGEQMFVARGLLARAELHRVRGAFAEARRDLDEAYEIAVRGGMRLHECDAYLEAVRMLLAMVEGQHDGVACSSEAERSGATRGHVSRYCDGDVQHGQGPPRKVPGEEATSPQAVLGHATPLSPTPRRAVPANGMGHPAHGGAALGHATPRPAHGSAPSWSRLGMDATDPLGAARQHLERAEALIAETGYHRRDREVKELAQHLA